MSKGNKKIGMLKGKGKQQKQKQKRKGNRKRNKNALICPYFNFYIVMV